MTVLDSLKYVARKNSTLVDWVHATLAEQDFGRDDPVTHHGVMRAVNGLSTIDRTVQTELAQWAQGENGPDHYSDGRPITTSVEAEPGTMLTHIWHPNPDAPLDEPFDVNLPSGRIATVTPCSGQRVDVTLSGWWRAPDTELE